MFHFKNKNIMKSNKLIAMAAIVYGFAMSFTACTNNDNPVGGDNKQSVTITFEDATLNADGFWCGDESGVKFDNWGSDAYACFYKEGPATFPVNYTPAWSSWSGFAVSSRTENTFNSATMTPDQFNSAAGGAHNGKNFCVVYPYGESLDFDGAVTVKGFWVCNSAWTVDAILNGDGMSPGKFEADDFLKCIIMPVPANGGLSGARIEIDLAKNGDYIKDWQYIDLSGVDALKNIISLSFSFDGSKKNDYGLTTPTYVCIDDIELETNL